MKEKLDARLTYILLILCACTILSWWLGGPERDRGHVAADTLITICVMAIGLFKAWLIIRQFMEVRTAPRWLRVFTDVWLVAFWGAVLGLYLH